MQLETWYLLMATLNWFVTLFGFLLLGEIRDRFSIAAVGVGMVVFILSLAFAQDTRRSRNLPPLTLKEIQR